MSKGAIRNFPQEAPYGPWPLLQPTQEDKQYQPILETDRARARRLVRENRELFYLDLRDAVLKGLIIGLFFFGIIFGIALNLPFWLQDWHWAFSIVGALVLGILVGLDLTLVVLATGAFVLSLLKIAANPSLLPLLLLFIVSGMVLRGMGELFYRDTP